MAKYTKKQISDLTGMPTNKLAVYIQRGKLVLTDGLINDANETNKFFIERHAGKKTDGPPPPRIDLPTIPEGYTAMSQMAMQKDQLDIEKKVIEIKLKKLDHQKKLGELVPTDLVRSLFIQHSKSIMTAFHDEADNFLMEISKEAGLTRDQLAKMRGKLVLKINQGIENSLRESKKSLQAIVEEYRALRGVGEHD